MEVLADTILAHRDVIKRILNIDGSLQMDGREMIIDNLMKSTDSRDGALFEEAKEFKRALVGWREENDKNAAEEAFYRIYSAYSSVHDAELTPKIWE